MKEIEALKKAKEIEDMLVIKLKVNTEELKGKEDALEKLRQEKELLEKKIASISETYDITQANEANLQQEIEHFKQLLEDMAKTKDSEKVKYRS